MFYTQNTENFQPDKFPENCQAGKFGASLKLLQKLNLNRDQKINITQTFEQEDMIVQKETTTETPLHPCHAWFGRILHSDDGSSVPGV